MNREEIIEMAREAGFPFNKYGLLQADEEGEIDADEMLKKFAALVAAKEREACADKAKRCVLGLEWHLTRNSHRMGDSEQEFVKGVISISQQIESSIRARGQQ